MLSWRKILPNGYFIDEDLERVVKDHPKFFFPSLDTFKIFLASYEPLNLLERKVLKFEDAPLWLKVWKNKRHQN